MNIEYTSLNRIADFRNAVGSVARERRYLLFTEAPAIEKTRAFVEEIVEKQWTQFLAIDADRVVGWCDIIPYPFEGCGHVGHLGMGVVPGYRRQGIGKKLLQTAIDHAFESGIERIELEVFSTNTGAIALYESAGFAIEGRKRMARRIDGVEHDNVIMALFKTAEKT